MEKKRILIYGDSNTHGFRVDNGLRYDRNTRWTGVCQNLLGEEYEILEEGLNGRTTCHDDYGLEFRNEQMLNEHYEKHGIEMGFSSAEAYEDAAEAVVNNSSVLHKIEAEDGDDVYYLQESNEFVVVSKDGYIRTYFCPEDGIEYFHRQYE